MRSASLLRAALVAANAAEFVDAAPRGVDTRLGQGDGGVRRRRRGRALFINPARAHHPRQPLQGQAADGGVLPAVGGQGGERGRGRGEGASGGQSRPVIGPARRHRLRHRRLYSQAQGGHQAATGVQFALGFQGGQRAGQGGRGCCRGRRIGGARSIAAAPQHADQAGQVRHVGFALTGSGYSTSRRSGRALVDREGRHGGVGRE